MEQEDQLPHVGHQLHREQSASHSHSNSHPLSHSQYQGTDNSSYGLGLDGMGMGNLDQQYNVGDLDLSQNQSQGMNPNLNLDNNNNNESYLTSQQDQMFAQSSIPHNYQQSNVFPQFAYQDFKQEDTIDPQQHLSFADQMPAMGFSSAQSDFNLYSQSAGIDTIDQSSLYLNDPSASQSVNPADLMSNASSPLSHAQSPRNLLTPDIHQPFAGTQSPFIPNHFSRSPGHSRQVSLGPESAAFPNAQIPADWMGVMPPQFRHHRRSVSEFSDVTNASAHASPSLRHHDPFDGNDHLSPLFPAQTNRFPDGLELNNFSLSDGAVNQHAYSPAHTPQMSPLLTSQQGPSITPAQQFLLNFGFPPDSQVYNAPIHNSGTTSFVNDQFPSFPGSTSNPEMGQAQQMIPPEINVEFAPASRQNSFEPPKLFLNEEGLTPPDRGRRRRAASDLTGVVRSASSNSRNGSLAAVSSPARSLSIDNRLGVTHGSRGSRRQSTSALPNREYILGLADPDHHVSTGADSSGPKRVQKHPATFQCTLCPKRFTRAYNLRSHLRTHTDERPFVCTVCGKAFARQHDRKRHEGLHSGEKKFVCKGELKRGESWGCGRRFARADALGRHFRSEAGRVCIKPLLDEEALERQRQWQEQQMQNMSPAQPLGYDANGFPIDASGNYALPAALLAQYPALATISWSDIGQGDGGMDDDMSGRSSFDASASDYYEEGGDDGYLSSGPSSSHQQAGQQDYIGDFKV